LKQIRRDLDPVKREVKSFMDNIRDSIPGFSTKLPPVIDPYDGKEMPIKTLGVNSVFGLSTTELDKTPGRAFIRRMDIDLPPVPRSFNGENGAPAVDLTQTQYNKLCKLIGTTEMNGKTFSDMADEIAQKNPKLMPDPNGYKSMPELMMKELFSQYMSAAKDKLISEDKKLSDALRVNVLNSFDALKGQPTKAKPKQDLEDWGK
jgi:hypothetical protein